MWIRYDVYHAKFDFANNVLFINNFTKLFITLHTVVNQQQYIISHRLTSLLLQYNYQKPIEIINSFFQIAIAEPPSEDLVEVMHEYHSLDNFWKRYNKVLLDKLAMDKEKQTLTQV